MRWSVLEGVGAGAEEEEGAGGFRGMRGKGSLVTEGGSSRSGGGDDGGEMSVFPYTSGGVWGSLPPVGKR